VLLDLEVGWLQLVALDIHTHPFGYFHGVRNVVQVLLLRASKLDNDAEEFIIVRQQLVYWVSLVMAERVYVLNDFDFGSWVLVEQLSLFFVQEFVVDYFPHL
jgi:hypothetical protein